MSDMDEAIKALESAESDGGVTPEQAPVGGEADGNVTPEAFFEWEDPATQEHISFENKGKLADYLKHSSMRRSELDGEKKKIAEQREAFERKMKSFESERSIQNERYADVMKMDSWLKTHPDAEALLVEQMRKHSGNPDLEQLFSEKLKPMEEKLSAYEKEQEDRRNAEKQREVFAQLAKKHKDFNEEKLTQFIAELQEVPETDQEFSAHEVLYYALLGKQALADLERRAASQPSKRPSITGSGAGTLQPKKPGDMTEQERDAMAAQILSEIT